MYKFLLTFRYLRRKLTPWFALIAVMLCTAMIIIVGSIMGGFLDMVRTSAKSVTGDVIVHYPGVSKMPFYDEIIDEITKTPEAHTATPIIHTYGLLKFPRNITQYVEVYGIIAPQYAQVTSYKESLFWNTDSLSNTLGYDINSKKLDPMREAMTLHMPKNLDTHPTPDSNDSPDNLIPAMVSGIELNPFKGYRTDEGEYKHNPNNTIVPNLLPLTVVPLAEGGSPVDTSVREFMLVNEFHSGFYLVDNRRVYVPFSQLQKMLLLDEAEEVDDDFNVTGTKPARCTEIHISANEDISPEQLRDAAKIAYTTVAMRHIDDGMNLNAHVSTWEERQRQYIATIEHEKGLLTVLFGIISIVAVVMIAVIFYMIVLEKTRDIGILRSLGASRAGVASIFLFYGTIIGTIGAALGVLFAYIIVSNVNEIHAWLGRTTGIVIWDRSVYFFDTIPHRVDPVEVAWISAIAIIFSVLGALIPAIVAARLDPVEALRYE